MFWGSARHAASATLKDSPPGVWLEMADFKTTVLLLGLNLSWAKTVGMTNMGEAKAKARRVLDAMCMFERVPV